MGCAHEIRREARSIAKGDRMIPHVGINYGGRIQPMSKQLPKAKRKTFDSKGFLEAAEAVKESENPWSMYSQDWHITEKEGYECLPTKVFVNQDTGEFRLYSKRFVESRGSQAIIEELNHE